MKQLIITLLALSLMACSSQTTRPDYPQDLPFAQEIALKQTSRTSLVAKFDKVLVQDQIPESCTIDKIYELTEEQHEDLADFAGGHIKATKTVD